MSATYDAAAVTIALDRADARYAPGDELQVNAEIAGYYIQRLLAVELSVVWCTTGKGDEDLHVHEFQRAPLVGEGDAAIDSVRSIQLSTVMPKSPLSYAGRIVKVCWAARLRLFQKGGRQSLIEAPLQLGQVLAAPAELPADAGAWGGEPPMEGHA